MARLVGVNGSKKENESVYVKDLPTRSKVVKGIVRSEAWQ